MSDMFGICVHGGAGGTSPQAEEGVQQAAEIGMQILRDSGSALDAAVAAVVFLENSGVFNAGVGSILREDGYSIQMDAAVATSQGVSGAVGAAEDIKNPVLLAKYIALYESARFITGEGATEMAREQELDHHPGPTKEARDRWEDMMKPDDHDTVGAVVLDRHGIFATASSTGGSGRMPLGRVGDVPMRGAGYEIGAYGAAIATGVGEAIIARNGSSETCRRLSILTPQKACKIVVDSLFPDDIEIGFIAITLSEHGAYANCPMATYGIMEEV